MPGKEEVFVECCIVCMGKSPQGSFVLTMLYVCTCKCACMCMSVLVCVCACLMCFLSCNVSFYSWKCMALHHSPLTAGGNRYTRRRFSDWEEASLVSLPHRPPTAPLLLSVFSSPITTTVGPQAPLPFCTSLFMTSSQHFPRFCFLLPFKMIQWIIQIKRNNMNDKLMYCFCRCAGMRRV